MIGKILAVLITACAIVLPLSSDQKKPHQISQAQKDREIKEHYALILTICYQSSKCLIGSYIALGSLFNSLGAPFNHPALELYRVDKRITFLLIFPATAMAYHGFIELSKILDTQKSVANSTTPRSIRTS